MSATLSNTHGHLEWLISWDVTSTVAGLITACLLAITIIGIPFAWAHLKLAGIALWPVGKMIVDANASPLQYQRPQGPSGVTGR